MSFKFLEILRDEGKIDDTTNEAGQREFETAVNGLRKFESRVRELEKEVKTHKDTVTSLYDKLGIDESSGLDGIETLLKSQTKGDEAKLKALERQVKELSDGIAKEKSAKLEAVKRSELAKIVQKIENLHPDHREIVEIKLGNALKIDDNGNAYFDKDGTAMDIDGYVSDFIKTNERYVASAGKQGGGTSNGYKPSQKAFSEMSLTEKSILFKENPAEYERLKNIKG